MNSKRFLILFCASLALVGCQSHHEPTPAFNSSLGSIKFHDIQQANTYRRVLPGYLNLPPRQVRVDAGSGVAHLTITGVHTKAEKKRITSAIIKLNAQNPKGEPLKLKFE